MGELTKRDKQVIGGSMVVLLFAGTGALALSGETSTTTGGADQQQTIAEARIGGKSGGSQPEPEAQPMAVTVVPFPRTPTVPGAIQNPGQQAPAAFVRPAAPQIATSGNDPLVPGARPVATVRPPIPAVPTFPVPTPAQPPTTLPPTTLPPTTQPPTTQPPATQAPTTPPPTTTPPTKPPVTKPPVTKPPVTEPPVTQQPTTPPPTQGPPTTQAPPPQAPPVQEPTTQAPPAPQPTTAAPEPAKSEPAPLPLPTGLPVELPSLNPVG